MIAPAGKAASLGVGRGEPEHSTPAVPWEVCGTGEEEVAAERQTRVISATPKRRAGCWGCVMAGVEMQSWNTKLCPRVFAKCFPQLWGWARSAGIVLGI